MSAELKWTVETDGREHEITCVPSGNKYIIYDGDDHIKTVYQKLLSDMRGGLDEELEIGGEPCRFTVRGGEPDIVWRGRLINSGEEYSRENVLAMVKYRKAAKYALFAMIALIVLNFALRLAGLSHIAAGSLAEVIGCYCVYALIIQLGFYKTRAQRWDRGVVVICSVALMLCLARVVYAIVR